MVQAVHQSGYKHHKSHSLPLRMDLYPVFRHQTPQLRLSGWTTAQKTLRYRIRKIYLWLVYPRIFSPRISYLALDQGTRLQFAI